MSKHYVKISAGTLSKLILLGSFMLCSAAAHAAPITLSGMVYDDANAGTINGTPIARIINNTQQLYVYLLDNTPNNTILAKSMVDTAAGNVGNYSIGANSGTNYNIALSTSNFPVGTNNPNLGLPASYQPTAEGTTPTGDGVPDYGVAVSSSSNLTINFGIDARPLGNSYNISTPAYDGDGRVIIPAQAFTGSDQEDGTYTAGFSGRSIDLFQANNGTLYYNGVAINFSTANTATRISNFNVNLLRLQLNNAPGQISFAFATVDNANVPELVPNSITVTNPLPVNLLSFSGQRDHSGVKLGWATAMESGSDRFVLERSEDGIRFSEIGRVATKAPSGNSHVQLSYSYMDTKAFDFSTNTAYYRMKQLDVTGRYIYAGTIRIALNGELAGSGIRLSPNPAANNLQVAVSTGISAGSSLSLFNAGGQEVYHRTFNEGITGNTVIPVDVSNLPNGFYFVKLGAAMQRVVISR